MYWILYHGDSHQPHSHPPDSFVYCCTIRTHPCGGDRFHEGHMKICLEPVGTCLWGAVTIPPLQCLPESVFCYFWMYYFWFCWSLFSFPFALSLSLSLYILTHHQELAHLPVIKPSPSPYKKHYADSQSLPDHCAIYGLSMWYVSSAHSSQFSNLHTFPTWLFVCPSVSRTTCLLAHQVHQSAHILWPESPPEFPTLTSAQMPDTISHLSLQ